MKKLLILSSLATLLFAGNVDEGVVALKNGDYESALAHFTYAANSGDKIAQQNLGVMYQNGMGVSQDNIKASYWFNRATKESVYSQHM